MVKSIVIIVLLSFQHFAIGQTNKETALKILEEKCNTCHLIEKPESIFTVENMDLYSKKINRQVFIFKIMPKGEEVKLDEQEKEALKSWLKWVKTSNKK
jgi:uncharacterized membrane protein